MIFKSAIAKGRGIDMNAFPLSDNRRIRGNETLTRSVKPLITPERDELADQRRTFLPLLEERAGVRMNFFRTALVFLSLSLFTLTLNAETILLKDAIVHTITGPTLSPGNVLIENGKILQVTTNDLTADKTISLEGLHLYPGMIALNTSLGLTEIGGVRSTRDLDEVGQFIPDVRSWMAVNPDSELLPVARANGVTHIEPTPQGGTIAGQSGLIVLDGWTTEQLAWKKPVALHVFWPNMELNTTPKEKSKDKAKWKSLEDQAKEREKKLKELDDYFADATAYVAARKVSSNTTALNPAWEAMMPYVRGELPITIHADEFRQIKTAINWSKDKNYKIIIAGARDAWMEPIPSLLKSNNIPVTYDNTYTQPSRDNESYDAHFRAPEILRKAGVKVALSVGASTSDAALIKNLPYTAAQAVPFGLSAEEAVKGITLYPAHIMGVADHLGSIEPGKDATFFASDGEILDIRANVRHLWIAGKEIPLTTRHTRLYEKYRARPKP